MVSFLLSVLGVTLAAAIYYYHGDGNVNVYGAFYADTYVNMGIGLDWVVNETDLILFDRAYVTNNVTNTWGVDRGLFNLDCDFDDDGDVDPTDFWILAQYYSGAALLAVVGIQPTTLNLKSSGAYISVYIEFPDYPFLNNLDIDLTTVRLEGVGAIDFIAWHKVRFDRAMVREALTHMIDYDSGLKYYDLELTIVGRVSAIPFEGSGMMTVIAN